MQGRAPGEWELVPQGGLGGGGLSCSDELQEENKDREGKEHCEREKSVGMRASYHNSALIISCLGNMASSAGWGTVLLG